VRGDGGLALARTAAGDQEPALAFCHQPPNLARQGLVGVAAKCLVLQPVRLVAGRPSRGVFLGDGDAIDFALHVVLFGIMPRIGRWSTSVMSFGALIVRRTNSSSSARPAPAVRPTIRPIARLSAGRGRI